MLRLTFIGLLFFNVNIARAIQVDCSTVPPNEQCSCLLSSWIDQSHQQYPQVLNFKSGQEELHDLVKLNEQIENMSPQDLTREKLLERGWIQLGNQQPKKQTRGKEENLDFTELHFPLAHTGALIPKVAFDPLVHKHLLILLPGMGAPQSHAHSVADIAQHFTNKKFRPEFGDQRDMGGNPVIHFRAYSIPVDMPYNGMATDCPDAFGTAQGTLTVLRHVHLLLMHLYPGIPVSIGGRSQGGIIAMQMAERYGPAEGLHSAFAVNPSPPDLLNLIPSVKLTESASISMLTGEAIELVPKPWLAHRIVTPTYEVLPQAKARTAIYLGKGDPSYIPATYYSNFVRPYVESDPEHRSVRIFEPPPEMSQEKWELSNAHDLWRRGNPRLSEIVADMTRVMMDESGRP